MHSADPPVLPAEGPEVRVRYSTEKPEPALRKGSDREKGVGRPFLKYYSPYNHNTHKHAHTHSKVEFSSVCVHVVSLLDLFPLNCGRKTQISPQTQTRIMIQPHDDPPLYRQTHTRDIKTELVLL